MTRACIPIFKWIWSSGLKLTRLIGHTVQLNQGPVASCFEPWYKLKYGQDPHPDIQMNHIQLPKVDKTSRTYSTIESGSRCLLLWTLWSGYLQSLLKYGQGPYPDIQMDLIQWPKVDQTSRTYRTFEFRVVPLFDPFEEINNVNLDPYNINNVSIDFLV